MLWSKAAGAGGTLGGGGGGVLYSGSSGSVTTGGLVVPATTSDQMLVLITRTNTSTPATTLSGFTSAVVTSNSYRSLRIQYRVGAYSSEVFDTGSTPAYIILDNATSIGQIATRSSDYSGSGGVPYGGISGVSSDGSSLVGVFSYYPTKILTVSNNDFVTIVGVCGYQENAPENFINGVIFHDSEVYELSATVEFMV